LSDILGEEREVARDSAEEDESGPRRHTLAR
jgi:hypothetical protein